ncbi:e3 ubiquitin-protein ligase [Gigaspora margarita]|uniref:E3 ubiquitin-protein ligase n=1 Tax=Gigaspora margarita TaxID=4874 RepID=A0A8H4AJB1_GIGMA|nr:e3 ubiquitin-protein ligase [Gigaspora margarita]
MMTPQAYRILHLFVHTILCSSASSSVTFFAKNGNNTGDTIAHCLNNIRNDWKILKVIYDCNDEQLALILHSIIFSMFKELSSQEWRLNTPEKRENWEDQFSKNHYVSYVIVTVQDIRNEMSRDRISLTVEKIDDMLSPKDPEYFESA